MNYENIANAVRFYSARGYVYEEDAPWIVSRDAYYATKPPGATDVTIESDSYHYCGCGTGYPVASAEQSFIQMMLEGRLIKRAIAVTPCFRAEPRVDTLHRPYFMKAELINAQDVDEGHLLHMVHDACSFFEQSFPVRVVKTNVSGFPSFDIVEKESRMELGSYGIRSIGHPDGRSRDIEWIYGTACAEPRFSTVRAAWRSRAMFPQKSREWEKT